MCKNSSSRTDDALLSSLKKLVMGTELYGSRPCMNIYVCSERQVQLSLEMLKEFSDELVPVIVPSKGGSTQSVRVFLTSSKEDKDLFERELQNVEEEQNKRVRGFREISHLFIQNFSLPCPVTNIPAAISYLNNHYFAPIDLETLPEENEGKSHRHNVVKICYLFAKLCTILKIPENDKSCAIVVFHQPGLSETFLDVVCNKDVCGSLREMVSGGLRATSYQTYKRVCNLGLWEADLAGSLDKALEHPDYNMEADSTTNRREILWSTDSMIKFDDL
ncbi:hypothetical protein ACLB2K_016253 [Fragaria x ananassa]